MKVHSKKLLSVLLAMMMALGLMAPALASEGGGTSAATPKSVQITKTLKIGQGIEVPNMTFSFSFTPATQAEAEALGDTNGFINSYETAHQTEYPHLSNATVAFGGDNGANRSATSTDTEMTFMSNEVVLNDSGINWPGSGVYIYKVQEVAPSAATGAITYNPETTYFVKVFVKNSAVDSVIVMGWDTETSTWVKVNGAPTSVSEPGNSENDDGCADYAGNEFLFVNSYSKMVDKHPIMAGEASYSSTDTDHSAKAFKLTKKLAGSYANTNTAFDFTVTVEMPNTFDNSNFTLTATTNAYTAGLWLDSTSDSYIQGATQVDGNTVNIPNTGIAIPVYLKDGETFTINELPAGAIVHVTETQPDTYNYVPSYAGKWGLDISSENTGNDVAGANLTADHVVVGDHGAYITFTNTMEDITPTGIVISNLPYILMVGISLAGIGFFTLSKKRRNG